MANIGQVIDLKVLRSQLDFKTYYLDDLEELFEAKDGEIYAYWSEYSNHNIGVIGQMKPDIWGGNNIRLFEFDDDNCDGNKLHYAHSYQFAARLK